MLRISKLTDYATALLTQLAGMPERQVSAQQLATEARLPLPTVAALLKRLGRAGLVRGSRGVAGGYSLARPPKDISVAEIIAVIEGPVALTECALGDGNCSLESDCVTRANWRQISRAVRVALEAVTLADMTRPAGKSVPRTVKFLPMKQPGLKESP
jgi:FeS assembly SUF system regulator